MVGPPQVAFAALSLGHFGPRNGGARSSRVSASGFSSFIFWGGVNLAFRGDQGWRPPHHALDHPTSVASPCANFEDRAFQVEEGGSLGRAAGAARSGESVREPESLGQGSADSRSPSFLKPPQGQALKETSPRGRYSEKELCLSNVVFLSPFPSLLLPPPPLPPFFFQIAVYDCWDNRGGNKEPAERKVLYKTNEHIAGRRGIVS